MNDQSDSHLLQAYASRQSEPAFAELVRRHVDLVYSCALRMVCDSHLAEDVTQGVFVALAKSAGQLTNRPVLSGWLHRTTQNIAAQTVRTDVRRRTREQEAAAMNELLSAGSDVSWDHIAPHLDAALGELSEADRDAVLLRYFEKKSAQEMAECLGISDEAAQKRVSRAVERLREFFAKRGVSVGAGGLVVLISANAVQAAPAGLAVTISAAALAGTAATTSTIIAATTKTIAMTTLQKTLVTVTVAVLAGAGIYEARQAVNARAEAQTLRQQQALQEEQVHQLQIELDSARSRVAALNEELARSPRDNAELLKLRGEISALRNTSKSNPSDALLETAARNWLSRANQLKYYVEQNPSENIPELQFLTDREWLIISGDTGLETESFRTPDDFRRGMELLRGQAESRFGNKVSEALRKYASINNGGFPAELSQLKPYCEMSVGELLVQSYEIKPSTVLSSWLVKDMNIKTDWVVTRKTPVNANSSSRLAIFADGGAYWQSPR